MKIAITSDIHLEFGDWYPVNPENADVLILSGDIMTANEVEKAVGDPNGIIEYKGHRFIQFLENCVKEYKHVVYVMGNHEHYHGDFATSATILGNVCHDIGVKFLDKSHVTIDDVTFIGGTLWTDMNKEDSLTLYNIKGIMNDFRCVTNSNRIHTKTRPPSFTPEDSVEDHRKMLEYIRLTTSLMNKSNKYVVVGHHAPSKQSTHPRYKDETMMNGAYSSDLSDFILDHPEIKLWTHGHTHELFDYMIGSTRIVCNPRGYVNYERESNDKEPYFAKVIEV
jgi:Icc-related predicted phosphoesterase